MTDADRSALAKLVATYKTVRTSLDADYYPLFAQQRSLNAWTGWEFNDPKKGTGFFVLLRPADSPYASAELKLQGLETGAQYRITTLVQTGKGEVAGPRSVSGADMATPATFTLPPGAAEVYGYEKVP